jgi:hypothetical protein
MTPWLDSTLAGSAHTQPMGRRWDNGDAMIEAALATALD